MTLFDIQLRIGVVLLISLVNRWPILRTAVISVTVVGLSMAYPQNLRDFSHGSVINRWPTLRTGVISVTIGGLSMAHPLYRRDFSHGRWPIDGLPSEPPWFQSRFASISATSYSNLFKNESHDFEKFLTIHANWRA